MPAGSAASATPRHVDSRLEIQRKKNRAHCETPPFPKGDLAVRPTTFLISDFSPWHGVIPRLREEAAGLIRNTLPLQGNCSLVRNRRQDTSNRHPRDNMGSYPSPRRCKF